MYLIYKNNKLKIYEYKTFFKKLFGLMNKKNISYGIKINNCNSIHTFFMKENIDVCITDKTNNIIYLKENLCTIYDKRPLLCRVDACYELYFKEYMTRDEYYRLNKLGCENLKKTEE